MSAAQSTDDRAAAHSTSCTDGGTGSRGRATPGVLARTLRLLLRLPGAGAVGGEPVLPGTREGGSAWGRGRALGSLLSNRLPSCLRPGQPPLKHSAPLHRRSHQEERPKDGTREREKGREGRRDQGALGRLCKPFGASRANPKKIKKEERQTERKPDLRRKEGRGVEGRGGQGKKDEKKRGTDGRPGRLWYLEYQLLQFRVCSLRQADRRSLSVCLSVCSFLRGTQVGVGYVAPGSQFTGLRFCSQPPGCAPWRVCWVGGGRTPLTRLLRPGDWEEEPQAWWSREIRLQGPA